MPKIQFSKKVSVHAVIPFFTFWTLQFVPMSRCLASEDSCPLLQIALLGPYPWTGVSCFRICLRRLLPAFDWTSIVKECLDLVHPGFLCCWFFFFLRNDCFASLESLTLGYHMMLHHPAPLGSDCMRQLELTYALSSITPESF